LGIVQYTVTDALGSRSGNNLAEVSATLGMTEAQLRAWGGAAAGIIEGRSVTINSNGHTETISRGMFGRLQYTVADEFGSRTGCNRENVMATIGMDEYALADWARDNAGVTEARSATINQYEHTETISRGMFGIVQYTVSDMHGSRTSRSRLSVLATLSMTEPQLRSWVGNV
jgi:ABC-type protease/lipase transport system fused ATPase/permease subunit